MNADNTIPAASAIIVWDWTSKEDGRRLITEVEVFDQTKQASDYREDLSCSWGGCLADWMNGDPSYTPEGLYVRWTASDQNHGFATPEHHVLALERLAKIEGCSWARTMAEALKVAARIEGDVGDEE